MSGKETKQYKPSVIALDTNTFITMANLDPEQNVKHGVKIGFKQSCRDIRRMAANGHVKFIITPTALAEIMRGLTEKEKTFLNGYCFIYNPADEELFALQTYALARQYTSASIMRGEKEDGKPTKDALIMAESTIIGLSLLTNNVKDFTNYDRHRHERSGQRMLDITHINNRMPYAYYIGEQKIVPAPYTSYEFLRTFRDDVFKVTPEFYELLEKAIKNNQKQIVF